MSTSLVNPPKTIMEVYKSLPEGTLAELIDNVIVMSPSPNSEHQDISMELSTSLHLFIKQSSEKGKVYHAPMDVYLDEDSNAVQPDIVVLLGDNVEIVDPKGHIHGVPDILVEILSPGNKKHDMVIKKELYERFGVKEYWVIDPKDKLAIGYQLENKAYNEFFKQEGSIHSRLLGFTCEF